MDHENVYSIQGFAHVFHELNEHNSVLIDKSIKGSGWDELVGIIEGLLTGMKCDFRIADNETH